VATLIGPNGEYLTNERDGDAWSKKLKSYLCIAAMSQICGASMQWQDILSRLRPCFNHLASLTDPRPIDYLLRIAYVKVFLPMAIRLGS
jgi:hypothetical protein